MKQFKVYSQGVMYKLAWEGGGAIPVELQGGYTSYGMAMDAADHYMANRVERASNVRKREAKEGVASGKAKSRT